MTSVDISQTRKEYAQALQMQSQKIAYLFELYKNGEHTRQAEIISLMQEHRDGLKILGKGGRIPDTDIVIDSISRLPGITFRHLYEKWTFYSISLEGALMLDAPDLTAVFMNQDTTGVIDSTAAQPMAGAMKKNNHEGIAAAWLTLSGWYDRLISDLQDETNKGETSLTITFLIFAIIDLILLASLIYLFNRFIIQPLNKLTHNTEAHVQEQPLANNEIGKLTTEINEIIEQLKDATEFVAAIGEGKLDYDYTTLDAEYRKGKNRLADSLIAMQQKLRSLNEDEQRRQWANEGLTKFVDILRSSDDNINILGDKIISGLVKYTNSNQGALYILNDEDEHNKHLELISLFAFDLKKYQNKKIKLGEGILGQTFLEKETTVLTEIPQEYIRITSGLGDATPKSLLIVPLKVDKEVYGIVELASFKNYQAHEITFVEKLAETIASTLASVKVGQKNRTLIEQFQQQTEEMRAQEEEMRQNMEELQATQEELSRKEQDYLDKIGNLESQVGAGVTKDAIDKIKHELSAKEQEYHNKVRDLERKLAERHAQVRGDDWELASEVEKTLRLQLEALKITQEEFRKKAGNE